MLAANSGACGSKLCHESADILLPGRRQRKRTAYPCTRSILTAGKRLCAVRRWILYTVEGVQYSSVGHGPRELQTTTPGLMSVYVWIESPSAPREDLYKPPRTRRFWASFKFSFRAFSCQKCNAVMLYTSKGSHHGSISRHYIGLNNDQERNNPPVCVCLLVGCSQLCHWRSATVSVGTSKQPPNMLRW